MLFNSIDFAIFLPIVFILYWFVLKNNLKYQNILILIVSYVFYGWWDWRFLSLILLSTIIDYFVGLKIYNSIDLGKKKKWLWISISFNLGILGFFKYFNFFIESWLDAFKSIGYELDYYPLNIILPVGISFYTFQTMSYSLDINKKRFKPTKDFIAFAAFVAFFPQLVAGPIERASNLLPQFFIKRKFEYHKVTDGLRQILWGLFKKIVIADNCAPYVNQIFNDYNHLNGSSLIIGVVLFAFQIYADFSGYTDIAIGVAKLFGFDFKSNFNYPYFATNISEFWKRWHISLSSWLNDYVFTPLAVYFRNHKKYGIFISVFITFLISGLWHGAGWNFIVWGGLHGLFYIPIIFSKKRFTSISSNRSKFKNSVSLSEIHKMFFTFIIVCFTYIFFRAESFEHAMNYILRIFSSSFFDIPNFNYTRSIFFIIFFIISLMIIDWYGKEYKCPLIKINNTWKKPFTWLLYYSIVFAILYFHGEEQQFIYFQF